MRAILAAFLVLNLLPQVALAAWSMVVSPEAQVYDKPDLDGAVVAVVKGGTRLTVSKGTRGEFQKFHKTRVNGKIGWIAVSDVRPEAQVKKQIAKMKKKGPQKGPFAEENAREKAEEGKREERPFLFQRGVGFAVGLADYREQLFGVERSAGLVTYGLKITGPDVLFQGPIMDVNILLHYGAPSYFESFSSTTPRGFTLWMDGGLVVPLLMRDHSLVGVNVGPLLILSNNEITQSGNAQSNWNYALGAVLGLSGGVQMGEFALRLDGRYFFEKQTYRHIQLSVQSLF